MACPTRFGERFRADREIGEPIAEIPTMQKVNGIGKGYALMIASEAATPRYGPH
jgi:hypothetical protein